MKTSIPFLATDIKQLPRDNSSNAVEAVIFNYEDLENSTWDQVWRNIKFAVKKYGASNVTFHFPVNNSDYVSDRFVEERLYSALNMASDLELRGVVVHSNRIKPIQHWQNIDLVNERSLVVEKLHSVRERAISNTFLALENMPIMDNYGIEIDPLFCFPADFHLLLEINLGIVWDICHYSNTLANIQEVLDEKQNRDYYPNFRVAKPGDFVALGDKISHWHFSAFKGIANPDLKTTTREGVLPSESYFGEEYYKQYLMFMKQVMRINQHIVFEIQEDNYYSRRKVYRMVDWFQKNFDALC